MARKLIAADGVMADGVEAARRIQRRMVADQRRRLKRDHKLGDDWLGRRYKYELFDQGLNRRVFIPIRLVGYDPQASVVKIVLEDHQGTVAWTTDEFWSAYHGGVITEI